MSAKHWCATTACGLVDNKICAVDDTWSALRLVIRVADRAGHADS